MTPQLQIERRPEGSQHDTRVWHDNHYRSTDPEQKPNAWDYFVNVDDPYNPGNHVTGYVQRVGGDEYGTLILSHVNGALVPQRILATPKTSYPYRRDQTWLLGEVEYIQGFLKYDGTNICQYSYEDANGTRYTTFKLRTRPFVPPRFATLLNRTLAKYPAGYCSFLEYGLLGLNPPES